MEGSNKASPDDIENPHVPLLMASSMNEELVMASSMREDLITVSPPSSHRIFRAPTVTSPDDMEDPHVPLLATSIREELRKVPPLSSRLCCIFRVPERIRYLNEKFYEPRVVSIGPLHHDEEASREEPDQKQWKNTKRAMEEHKKRYLHHFLNRTPVSLERFLQTISSQEADIRSCYAESIDNIGSDEFVKIILLDAIFILELLLRLYLGEDEQEGDRILNIPIMLNDIWPDLLLLENQLPFFILKNLWDLNNPVVSIEVLSLHFFSGVLNVEKSKGYRLLERVRSSHAQVKHFVDFIRQLRIPLKAQPAGELCSFTTPSITDLDQAGVKFSVAPNETYIFDLDIQFTDGYLKIPKIKIQDHTEVILRNLIAFEQCTVTENDITNYVIMMDRFVNTSKDVDLLVKNKIIENALGDSTAVSTLINALGNGVIWDRSKFHYAVVSEDLNNYCNKSCHKWKANLRQKYFNTPWAAISVVAAALLIILTIIQTMCAIISL